jgi:hypothetical protein
MDLDELAKQYGGVSATPESVNLDELAKKLGGTSRPVKERTVGEAFTDPAAKFASGIGQLIQFPGQIYGLTTGAIKDKDFATTGLQGLGQNIQDYAKKKLSEKLVSEEAETARKVEEAEKRGILPALSTQVGEVLKNPLTQGIGFAAEQLPQAIPSVIAALIPGVGPAVAAELRAAQVAAKAAAGNVAKKEAADAALKLAENAALKSQISRGTTAAIGTGAVQQGADIGSGSFEEIKQYLMTEKKMPEAQAAAEALNLARAAGASGAAISLLAQKLPGAQALERALAGERLGTGRIKGAIAGAIKNIPEEMVEEGGGKVTQNLALRDVNPEQSLTAGLGQTLGQAALGAGLIGGGAGAISGGKPTINPEDVKNAEFEKRKAEDIQRATEKRAEIAAQMEVVKNPVGALTEADLGPELTSYVNEHRTATGKPTLTTYSLDDVVDALPGKDKAKEAGALNALIAQKTGYTAEVYTPDQLTKLAEEKNVDTTTPGFGDFLFRSTGISDPAQMSQPQLHSAVTALQKLPTFETKQELPEGTNATRYSPEQLTKAIDGLNAKLDEVGKDELSFKETTKVVETATGLKGSAVNALLNDATKSGSIVTEGNKVSVPSRSTPSGYDIQEEVGVEEEQAESYDVMSGDQKVRSMDTQEKAEAHAEKLNSFAQAELKKTQEGLKAQEQKIAKSESELLKYELNGLVGTPAELAAQEAHQAVLDEAMPVIADLKNQEDIYSRPVTVVPVGIKKVQPKTYRVTKGETVKGTKATREEAEQAIFEDLSDKEIQELAKTKSPKLKARVNAEIERRATAPAPQSRTPEQAQKLQAAQATLQSMLGRFGLQDVALKIVDAIEQGAEGSYAAKVIQLAIDASQPVRVMRHEALHALKELGFFTDAQWASLQRQANAEWINKYLKGNQTRLPDGRIVSRYDAYIEVNQTMPAEWNKNNPDQPPRAVMSDAEIKELLEEEAIADAFGDFDVEKAPPGMLNALLNKLRNFFSTLKSYLNGQGYESYKDIFGKIEKGELKPSKPAEANKEVKKSLTSFGAFYGDEKQPVYTPLSTRNFMEQDMTASQQDLGLNTKAKRGIFNNVRDIASALNQYTIDRFGQMDRSNLSEEQSTQLAKAMADEVAFQLGTQATTGTGLGWYSNNYPKAVKRLASRFPELSDNKHARSVFSALVAVTSNGEKVNKNIDNAITLYSKLRDGKPLVAMGNRRATALENNLKMIQDLLNLHGTKFEKVLLEEITVKEMNARLREMGEDTDGSYLKDTTVPAAAVYFGPKLGAFYANLSGSEGYLTMDLWWTRSVNRMRGLLIPQATEASINKFRDMMEMPSATRDEVIAATIPLRNKYEEYGYSTELEYLAKGKEPAKKDKKPAWFKKAKAKAGAAYDQLLFEHNLEKMANTIYKNEFEMLEEAPFTATDRKFMYDAGRKAQTMLRKDGINLTLADIQAALWYYEKRLYEKLSGRKADDIGYEEAIIAQSGKTTGRARPSVVFDTELNRRDESGGAVKDAEELRGKSDYGPKYSLREAVRSYRGRNESEPETHTRRSIEDSEGIRVLGVKPIAEYKPTQGFKDIISDHGYESPVFYEISNEDAETYSDAIQASKNASPYGAAVYIYPLEDYAKMRLFTTKDGKAGFALKNDDIVSVFSSPPHKGSTYSSLQIAVQEGGRRLDAFDTVLPEIYHANGFKSVGRMRWNEDYIPDGWNKQTFTTFNNGEPDVVYMSYDPDDSTTLTQSPGEYYDDPDELVAAQARAVKNYFEEGEGYGSRKQNQRTGKLKASAQELPDQRRVRRDIQLLDDETRAKYPYLEEPVEGLPAKVKVDGVEVTFGPYIPAREAAILYAEKMGIPYRQQASYHKLDKKFSTLLANTYARMLNRPLAADVKEAYDAWAKETIAQYEAMIKTGITIEFMPNNRDPYGNPRNAILDVLNNNHLYVFPADGGFGKDAITEKQIRTNPALALTDIIISGRQARVVEVFRATHDFFGHVKEGFGFRAEGEENAFQSHVRMYSPLAARAMTAGTRGQNSDVNFGPNAEFNKTASGEDTIYADQKIGLMPEWATDSNIEPDVTSKPKLSLRTSFPTAEAAEDAAYRKAPPTTDAFKRWFGNSKITEEGRPVVMYHASPKSFNVFRERKPIFISPEPKEAEYFGRFHFFGNERATKPISIYPLWVRAENSFDYENPNHVDEVHNALVKMLGEDFISSESKRRLASGDWSYIEDPALQQIIKDAGFDSFYVKEGDTKNLAVFDANQVKSATGNTGEFGETKDMRYSLRNVNTPEFKRFYAGSKFVNADGTPKVLYHGTKSDIDTFKVGNGAFGRGIYVTEYPERTDQYWGKYGKFGEPMGPQGGNIMPVYVRMANPKPITTDIFKVKRPDGSSMTRDEAAEYITNQAIAEGYDGLVNMSGDKVWEAVVFNPYQIKSAIGNTGAYSRAEPSIKLSFPSIADQIAQTTNGVNANQRILDTTTAREEQGFIERMMSAISPESWSSFRAQAINRYNQMSVNDKKIAQAMGGIELLADASAEAAALQSDTAAGVAAAVMGYGDSKGGIPVYEKGYTTVSDVNGTVKGLTELLMPLAERGDPYIFRAFQFYSGVKRGTRLDADGKEKLFDKKDIQYAKDLELLYPEFKQVHADWINYNNGHVDYMVKTGVLTPEKGKIFKKYSDYIPFYRQLEGEETFGPNIFQSLANVKPPKKIKGGEAPLADFLETVVRNTQASIQSGMKNIAATRAIDQALFLGTASQLPQVSSAPNTVTLLRNGIPVSYAVSDRLLFDAMQSLHLPEMPFLGILAGPANLLRNLVTKDPGFMLANMMRDSLSAYATSGANMTPVIDTIRNFGSVMANRSPEFVKLVNAGVIGGYEFSRDVVSSGGELAKDLRKKSKTQTEGEKALRPITSLWGFLEKGTEASDAATRIAVYKDVMARTGNEAEAIRQAAEVMNFNRKGSSPIIRIVTASIPFLNARIQGLDVLYRAGMAPRPDGVNKTDHQRRVQKNFLIRGATMMALSSMYWFMMKDDDEYKQQEQEVRDNNWILPMINARIPIPFEVGVLFKVIPERLLAFAFGNDTGEDLANSMERALRSTFGVNYIPQTVLPLVEATTNYSYFTMRPIVSQGVEGIRPGLQVGPGTTQIAETVGKALNVSPIKIDHVVQGYTGTMGMYLVNTLDAIFDAMSDKQKPSLRIEQYPILKRFMIDSEAKGSVSAYFDLKKAVDETVRTVNALEAGGQGEELADFIEGKHRMFGLDTASLLGARGFITNMDAKMKPLLENARKIRASEMDPDEKREALSTINEALISMTSNIQEIKKGLSQ